MRRQFLSWTSGFGRHSRGFPGDQSLTWAASALGRRGRQGLLRSGWLWTSLVLILLLVGSMALLSLFSPAPVNPAPASIPISALPGSAPIVPPYDPNLGLAQETSWGRLILDMIFKLAIVIALIVGVIWLLRYARARFAPLRRLAGSPGSLRVLDSSQIGPGHSVYTVDLGRRILVLGATSSGVSLLTEVTNPDEIRDLRRRSGVEPNQFDSLIAAAEASAAEAPFQEVAQRLRNLASEAAEASVRPESGTPTAAGK